eukprot:s2707_g4.t2
MNCLKSLRHGLPFVSLGLSRCDEPKQRKPRVVVVGAGLTGCLTAAMLRRSLPELQIELWERATYPSGRFGAAGPLGADLGAQVLSVIEVDSGHPNAGADGHNLKGTDLCAAWEDVQLMLSQGWLRRAPEEQLGDTEERMKYQGLWAHFWCLRGFSWLLQQFLAESSAELRLGRVERVKATGSTAELWATERPSGQLLRDEADLVILAVPAPEALRLADLPATLRAALQQIRYDGRVAVALTLEHATYPAVSAAFAGAAEVTLDLGDTSDVHLVAWQNIKRGPVAHGDPMQLVIHSTCGAEWQGPTEALKAVSGFCGLPLAQLEGLLRSSKVIDWKICQMVQPLESIPTDLRLPEPCFQHGRILVAGDFWCQSSFLGCYCSAKAAVRQAVAVLKEGDTLSSDQKKMQFLCSFAVMSSSPVLRWNLAIATAAKAAKWKRAMSLMQRLKELCLQPDIVTFNTTLRACTRASRWRLAVQMLNSVRNQHGLQSDVVSYTSLLGFQKDSGAWIRALIVLHEMQVAKLQADATALNAVLADCMATGPWPLGLILLHRLQQFGPKAFAVALSTAMAGAVKNGRWDVALSLLQSYDPAIDGVLLATCMRVCRAGHLWQLGLSFLPRARADVAVYNAAISMCADAGQWQLALKLLGRTHDETRMDTTSCNAAITACDRGQAWQHALHIFHLSAGLRDVISYGAIISACRAQWPLTLSLLRLAASEDIRPGERAWSALFTSCKAQWELGLALAEEGRDSDWDLTCHNSVLHILATTGKWTQVIHLLRTLRESGPRPDAVTWDAACSAFETSGAFHQLPLAQAALRSTAATLCASRESEGPSDLWPLRAGLGLAAAWASGRLERFGMRHRVTEHDCCYTRNALHSFQRPGLSAAKPANHSESMKKHTSFHHLHEDLQCFLSMKPSCPSVVEAYAAPVNGTSRTSPAQAFSARVQGEREQTLQAAVALPPPKPRGPLGPPLRPKPAKQEVEALAKHLALAARHRQQRESQEAQAELQAALAAASQVSKARSSGSNARPRPGAVPAPSVLSHATTPSWRSRSKQALAEVSEGGGAEADADGIAPLPRQRLTPLLEKRWTAVEQTRLAPKSELERLERIDPDVDEANAMLVESFLNVKRSLGAEIEEATSQRSKEDPSASSYFVSKGATTPIPSGGLKKAGYQVLSGLPGAPLSARSAGRNVSALGSAYSCATDLSSIAVR